MKLFICDYVGTFTGREDRENELKNFFGLLDQLADDEQMMFSFVTTNSLKDLESSLMELVKYKNDKILIGPQYASDAFLDENYEAIVKNVPYKIDNIKDLLSRYQQFVTTVYYAEDALILQKMMGRIAKQYTFNYEAFMPGGSLPNTYGSSKKDLSGLNEAITARLKIQLESKKLS